MSEVCITFGLSCNARTCSGLRGHLRKPTENMKCFCLSRPAVVGDSHLDSESSKVRLYVRIWCSVRGGSVKLYDAVPQRTPAFQGTIKVQGLNVVHIRDSSPGSVTISPTRTFAEAESPGFAACILQINFSGNPIETCAASRLFYAPTRAPVQLRTIPLVSLQTRRLDA